MADANLMKIAESLGLEVRTRNATGKVWISGTTGEVLRAWAMAGYDRRTEPKTVPGGQDVNSYIFTLNGEYAGHAACLDGFAFSSTLGI